MFGGNYFASIYFAQGFGAVIPHVHQVLELTVYAALETSLAVMGRLTDLSVAGARETSLSILSLPTEEL